MRDTGRRPSYRARSVSPPHRRTRGPLPPGHGWNAIWDPAASRCHRSSATLSTGDTHGFRGATDETLVSRGDEHYFFPHQRARLPRKTNALAARFRTRYVASHTAALPSCLGSRGRGVAARHAAAPLARGGWARAECAVVHSMRRTRAVFCGPRGGGWNVGEGCVVFSGCSSCYAAGQRERPLLAYL